MDLLRKEAPSNPAGIPSHLLPLAHQVLYEDLARDMILIGSDWHASYSSRHYETLPYFGPPKKRRTSPTTHFTLAIEISLLQLQELLQSRLRRRHSAGRVGARDETPIDNVEVVPDALGPLIWPYMRK